MSVPPRTRVSTPNLSASQPILLSGRVVVDDGTELTEGAAIQTICRGQQRTETHTDPRGNFSFQSGVSPLTSNDALADTDTSDNTTRVPNQRDLQDCELRASLAGFSSDVIQLSGKITGVENAVDIGRIVLHRLNNVGGFTISATTAEAPASAKKAFDKGRQEEQKDKWDQANKSFQKAVGIDPKFAAAWFELGLVQMRGNDLTGARNSFHQAIAADPQYVNPYHGLTQLATRERKWQELVDVSSKLLALNPVSFPDVWFSNGLGNYFLENLDAAEKSARRGILVDSDHHAPKLEYLLGMVLVKKREYQQASDHLQAFLHLTTNPAEVAETRKELDEIARLLAAATVPVKK